MAPIKALMTGAFKRNAHSRYLGWVGGKVTTSLNRQTEDHDLTARDSSINLPGGGYLVGPTTLMETGPDTCAKFHASICLSSPVLGR